MTTIRLSEWRRREGIGRQTAYRLIARGELRAHKITNAPNSPWMVSPEAAARFAQSRIGGAA